MNVIGLDIGGTNTTVTVAAYKNNAVNVFKSYKFKTCEKYIDEIETSRAFIEDGIKNYNAEIIGVSIGGPLDMEKGLIINPPHLPGYWNINLKTLIEREFNIRVNIVHDALSSAFAEYKWGNGKNAKNMVFMTFGTGFGAGFILNGKPYYTDKHTELGYNKISIGSKLNYDYVCSGSGLNDMVKKYGEEKAVKKSLNYLSYILSFLSNTLGLDKAVIGGVFTYRYDEFYPYVMKKFKKLSLNNMDIKPSMFGIDIGLYSSIAACII